ncbi:oligosaccharide flippase family protein [Nocardioides jensenii]|uniref:oligosaccharide flippase family protein n=1 Tax=Nocardioides jensenii TaxID=1843 RepID=UPI003898F3E0
MTFAGVGISSALGFVLSVLLARTLGTTGAGVVFQATAAFWIALSLSRLGLDTTAVWLLPRMVSSSPHRVRPAVVGLLVPALVSSSILALCWLIGRQLLADPAPGRRAVYESIDVVACFLPAAALTTVALAATRAFGGVVPFNAIDNLALPALRPLGVIVAVALGGATTAATLGWAVPWVVGMVAALLVLLRMLRRPAWQGTGGLVPDRELRRTIAGYAGPRAVAAALEQSIIWIDVILVGVIAGSAAAGVYGAAARFVAAGVIIATALRIVVAPRFSALLARGEKGAVEELYSVTARWILLFGAPVYLLLAAFAPTVLSFLGEGFVKGADAMVVLCLGSIVVLAAGNVQSLLLMSGRSGLGALNKSIVLAFNVAGNLVLVPVIGIMGAAITWAVSMLLDTALAAYQVRKTTGIALSLRSIGRVMVLVAGCIAVPAWAIALLWGRGVPQLLLAFALCGLLLVGACILDRRRLQLHELAALGRRRVS